jgi:hypothetical protein
MLSADDWRPPPCTDPEPLLRPGAAALVVAHPGHELRLHGWLEQTRPDVFVLTDGSGSGERSRLGSTRAVLEDAGARPGDVFGDFTDRELYAAILERDAARFQSLAETLADRFVRGRVDYVVTDAAEGYNSGHDLCRIVVEEAASLAAAARGRAVKVFDYTLVSVGRRTAENFAFRLSAEAVQRKVKAASGYPEMAGEVEAALRRDPEALHVEILRPASDRPLALALDTGEKPFYETYGEQQVAAGLYPQVIRLHEHLLPLAAAIHEMRPGVEACRA